MSKTYHKKWSNYLGDASSENQWIYFKKIATLHIKFSYLPKDQIVALGKNTWSSANASNESMTNLKSLTWKCINFPEQYPEQVQIGCITLWNKNLCCLLSLCICACMYEGTFGSVKYNVFSVKKLTFWTVRGTGSAINWALFWHLIDFCQF